VGVELSRRAQRQNDGTELGAFLDELHVELAEDRDTLLGVIRALELEPARVKVAAGWVAEKLGRLKLNGQLTGYSPLSRLVELEGLASGINAKLALWLSLAQVRDRDGRLEAFDFDALVARAESQRERLEPFRLAAATGALG
jgi:hypothetical protein